MEEWDTLGLELKSAVWTEGYASGERAIRRRLWRRVFLDSATSLESKRSTSDLAFEESVTADAK